jgi:putative ATPase
MNHTPLAEQLRPSTLAEFVGQPKVAKLVSTLLENAQESQFFPSLILWGPPGCGKTSLARLIAQGLGREFHEFSAVNASVKDIEKAIPMPGGQASLLSPLPPVVFLDEIHRFNKAQQDALLPHVERGSIVFLGATTENPSFSVIRALLSRCRVVVLDPLSEVELSSVLERALARNRRILEPEAQSFLLQASGGDARVLLNVLEIAGHMAPKQETLTLADLENALQRRQLGFDHGGEEFYNTISALHKSVRGSDPDAALYWLARMLEAGQDPLYVARRMIRMASEDIGLADPQALLIASAAFESVARIGMPECTLALAQAAAYLAKAPKSNALYKAYGQAKADVEAFGNLPVPLHIRNAPTGLMKDLGYGAGYDYSHSAQGRKKEGIEYFPDQLAGKKYLAAE